jgi:hypothetical protein
MGIQATEVGLTELHQEPTRTVPISGVLELVGLDDLIAA